MTYDRTNVIERDVMEAETMEALAYFATVMARAGLCTVDEWSRWNYAKREYVTGYVEHSRRAGQFQGACVEGLVKELKKRVF